MFYKCYNKYLDIDFYVDYIEEEEKHICDIHDSNTAFCDEVVFYKKDLPNFNVNEFINRLETYHSLIYFLNNFIIGKWEIKTKNQRVEDGDLINTFGKYEIILY